jgi:hypothetical protein
MHQLSTTLTASHVADAHATNFTLISSHDVLLRLLKKICTKNKPFEKKIIDAVNLWVIKTIDYNSVPQQLI